MARKKRRRNALASEAALEALVRFGPELSGLRELARQAQENYTTSIAQAHGTAQGIVGQVQRARPEVAKIYDRAGLEQARTASMVGGDIAALPGVANSIRAGAQLEASSAASRLQDAKTGALTDLSQRGVAAKEGEAFAVTNAHSELVDALTKVLTRKQDLRGEQGAFTALTTRQLKREARDRADKIAINDADNAQSERNSIRSSGVDPSTGRPIRGGKLDPKKKPRAKLPLNAQNVGIDNITTARALYRDGAGQKGFTEQGLRQALRSGRAPGDVHIPTVKSETEITAGIELAKRGTLTRATYHELLRRGYRVPRKWRPGHARVPGRPPTAPGPNGQQRPN